MRTLVVTGAGGYVGRALLAAARRQGWRVVAATRRPVAVADAWQRYALETPPTAADFPAGATLVHLAAATRGEVAPAVEIAAARALIAVARERGLAFVFVSSQASAADAPTDYGRTKHAIEALVLAAGGAVLRPGLVWGGQGGGLHATLARLAARAPLWPDVRPAPQVQPVHVDDLAAALLRVAEAPGRFAGNVLRVAEPQPVAFVDWMRALAALRGRRLRTLPVPAALVRAGAALAARAGGRELAARAQSLLALPAVDTGDDLARLGIALRPSREALAARAVRRERLAAARALLHYALGERPAIGPQLRLARLLGDLDPAAPPLGRAYLRWPALLRVADQPARRRHDPQTARRVQVAVALAEATPAGARRFVTGGTRATRIATAVLALGGEALARVAAFLLPLRR